MPRAICCPAAEHPVVLVHPAAGETVLFVNWAFTTDFSNFFNSADVRYGQDFMPEAHQLMSYPTSQAAIPEYQVRLKWRPNTVAMQDNFRFNTTQSLTAAMRQERRFFAPPSGRPLA